MEIFKNPSLSGSHADAAGIFMGFLLVTSWSGHTKADGLVGILQNPSLTEHHDVAASAFMDLLSYTCLSDVTIGDGLKEILKNPLLRTYHDLAQTLMPLFSRYDIDGKIISDETMLNAAENILKKSLLSKFHAKAAKLVMKNLPKPDDKKVDLASHILRDPLLIESHDGASALLHRFAYDKSLSAELRNICIESLEIGLKHLKERLALNV